MLTRAGIVGPVRRIKRLLIAGLAVAALSGLGWAGGELWVQGRSHGHIYAEADVPAAPVALVLGSEVYPGGTPSPFLAARLDIARRLLETGKVRAILVSGDHGSWEYDEPGAMAVYLQARGVAPQRIALDHAGFDTYDSCSRAHRVFGVREAIVVTQTYHLDRAVALCRSLGVDADGVGDDSVRVYTEPWRNSVVRERGAVLKAVADVVSGRDPVFLGPHETSVEKAVGA